jgi:hypothetical protein
VGGGGGGKKNIRGAPDSDFYYLAGYRICRISEKNLASYRIFYQFEYLTYNIYYKDFSHPCISAEEGDTIFLNF